MALMQASRRSQDLFRRAAERVQKGRSRILGRRRRPYLRFLPRDRRRVRGGIHDDIHRADASNAIRQAVMDSFPGSGDKTVPLNEDTWMTITEGMAAATTPGLYYFRLDGGGAGATHLYFNNAGTWIGIA